MEQQGLSPRDPSSYSRPELAAVTNIALFLTVDFDKKTLAGRVDLTVEREDTNVQEVILDAKDLNISQVLDKETRKPLSSSLSEPLHEYGSKFKINLPQNNSKICFLSVFYETSPNATGLQWLSPQQTTGKTFPYLFSQFQAIQARSVIPCQDTPAVKVRYTATITAPQELTVLMSAIRNENTKVKDNLKEFRFVQDVPVPSYLIAIAVGAIESRVIGPRSRVWAEKEIVEDCAYEFAETERQLATAEEICGPYVWGIYDLLVLPPSFPFGGMENPCLTFVTPTLLAGDRSLANVVAHEIAHSWTGNLITNRNFEHFWLNEGFTVFVERKIKGRLSSSIDQDFDALARVSELQESVDLLGKDNPLTQLVVNLKGVHPDDAFSNIPYEKGYTFLRYLEKSIGGPDCFEPFLKKYFENFKFKSIDTDDFKTFFETHFAKKLLLRPIDWNTWLYSPGMPPVIPDYDTSRAKSCKRIIDQYLQGELITPADAKSLTVEQQIYFLQKIVELGPQDIKKLKNLNVLFGLNKIKNAEMKFRWFRICLRACWDEIVEPVLSWVNEVGRMKYVRPLYRDMYDWETVRPRAIENFKANQEYMMHVVAHGVSKDLHLH